ncbi:MAG: hypothetical protein WBV61_02135 [Rhodanobacteraceae bacterium]
MRDHQKRCLIEVSPSAPLYAVAHWQCALIAPSPLPAVVWKVVTLVRRLLRKDEFEQRIELIAIAIAIAVASARLMRFAGALLESAALLPPGALFLVLPVLVLIYGLAKLCLRWRHR